jgi:hypothetical protein
MNKLFLGVTALATLGAAAPAAAQYGYQSQDSRYGQQTSNAGGGVGLQNRIAQLQTRLQTGVQSGAISRSEAQSLRPQLRQLIQLERQYSMNGLSQQERQDLQQRIRAVRQQLRMADGGANGQYAGWDREEDDYNDSYGNNGYNNGAYNNGAYNNGYAGQGGPYEEADGACETRGGIGGVISGLFGGGRDCLRVGQRVPSNLYAVPYEYQGRFRDGYGYYYRSDGRQIYQIDARTNTVLRVYAMNR